MQAVGIGPPLLDLKSLSPGRAQAYPAQDQFKSLLQQRIVSRGYSGSRSSSRGLDRTVLKAQLRQARPTAAKSSTSRLFAKMPKFTNRYAARHEGRDPLPLHITEKLANMENSVHNTGKLGETPASQTAAGSSSRSWQANLRARALALTQNPSQAAAVAPTATIEMPQVLKELIEFLNQQPGQALKVPPDRLPEVEAFLLKAGLPPEQVENLLASPRFQELGLTATAIQSAWQKAVEDTLQQNTAAELQAPLNSSATGPAPVSTGQTPAAVNPLLSVTGQPDYQRLWQDLTLPPQALADVRLELQQLGVPPEALADLNAQNFPQGIPLTRVWELIEQVPKPAALAADPAKGNTTPESPLLLDGGQEVEKWRQLLVLSGMDPELAQLLISGSSPANREELRTGLLKLAPPPESPAELEVPKPLYLPQSVRVRSLPLLQQQPDTGQEGSGDGGNWTRNFTFTPQAREINLPGAPNLNNFLALITNSSPLLGDRPVSAEAAPVLNSNTLNTYLTPAARDALWSQVQTGVLGNLRPGVNQVTLTLDPPEMGKLHLTLNVRGEMVEVAAVATQQGVAEAGAAGVQQLAQALNQQGLILTQFQFHHQDEAPGQSHLAFFQNSGDRPQAGQKDPDTREQPTTPRQRRWTGGIDCFA